MGPDARNWARPRKGEEVMGLFDDIVKGVGGAVGGIAKTLVGGVRSVGSGLWGGIKSTVGGQTSFSPDVYTLNRNQWIDEAQRAQNARQQQDYLTQQYQRTIEGNGPSVAELQQQQGLAEALRNASTLAANARGVSRGLAQREAAYAGEEASSQAMRDAALLRAQEQLAAREQMASVVGQQRQQDLTAQQLELEAEKANQQAVGQQQATQAGVSTGNAERAQKGTGAGLAMAAPLIGLLSDVRAKTDVQPTSANWGEALSQGLTRSPMGAPVAAAAPVATPSMQASANPVAGYSPVNPQALAASMGTADPGIISALSSGLSSAGAGLMSDKRSKENLGPVDAYEFSYKPEFAEQIAQKDAAGAPPEARGMVHDMAFADALTPRQGVMTQDLEESPEGKKAVIDGEMQAIDQRRALGFLLANQAGLNKRLEALEGGGRRAGKSSGRAR